MQKSLASIDESVAIKATQARWHFSSIEAMDRAAGSGPAVAVLCWPEDDEEVVQLARLGLAQLLAIGPTMPLARLSGGHES